MTRLCGLTGWVGRGVALAALGTALAAWPAAAQTKRSDPVTNKPGKSAAKVPADFRSQNFIVHSDLAADEAEDLLQRLETMLGLISAYWAHPPSGLIEITFEYWPIIKEP